MTMMFKLFNLRHPRDFQMNHIPKENLVPGITSYYTVLVSHFVVWLHRYA